jgi:hypothetical protein
MGEMLEDTGAPGEFSESGWVSAFFSFLSTTLN